MLEQQQQRQRLVCTVDCEVKKNSSTSYRVVTTLGGFCFKQSASLHMAAPVRLQNSCAAVTGSRDKLMMRLSINDQTLYMCTPLTPN